MGHNLGSFYHLIPDLDLDRNCYLYNEKIDCTVKNKLQIFESFKEIISFMKKLNLAHYISSWLVFIYKQPYLK